MSARPPAERERARYARAIERRFAERLERPLILSPRDWFRISEWYERGVPLAVVLEAIDAAFESGRRRPARPRSLAYIAALVEESWSAVRDGRVGAASEGNDPASLPAPSEAWRRRRDAEVPGSALRSTLDRLLGRLELGVDPAAVDRELDAELLSDAASDLARGAAAAADRTVDRLRGRVSRTERDRAHRLARLSWLRSRLGLPRLVS